MTNIRIRKYEDADGVFILMDVPGKHGDNSPRRMGGAAGHYARKHGERIAMYARAVREGDATFVGDLGPDEGYWAVRYRIETSHMPMDMMMEQLRKNIGR